MKCVGCGDSLEIPVHEIDTGLECDRCHTPVTLELYPQLTSDYSTWKGFEEAARERRRQEREEERRQREAQKARAHAVRERQRKQEREAATIEAERHRQLVQQVRQQQVAAKQRSWRLAALRRERHLPPGCPSYWLIEMAGLILMALAGFGFMLTIIMAVGLIATPSPTTVQGQPIQSVSPGLVWIFGVVYIGLSFAVSLVIGAFGTALLAFRDMVINSWHNIDIADTPTAKPIAQQEHHGGAFPVESIGT